MGLLACAVLVTRADGVTIVLKGKKEPIHGYLIKEDGKGVHVRRVSVGGSKVEIVPLSKIEFINRPLDAERLGQLAPDKPDDYRQYAEELSEQKVDPEARELAIRLFLISAHLDPDRLGRSCMLGLTNLSRTDEEKDRCRALAYMLDPEHDRSLLQATAGEDAGNDGDGATNDYKALVGIIEALNRGHITQAQGIARRNKVHSLLAPYGRLLTPEELSLALVTPRDADMSPELRLRILRFYHELLASKVPNSKKLAKRPTNKWSIGLLNPDNQTPVRTLSLQTITGYDPRENVYRAGKWVRAGP